MRAIKHEITDNLIEAYWKTLDISNKDNGLNLNEFNELLFNINFELRPRDGQQTIIQKKCPTIYNSKPSRIIIDFVNTMYVRKRFFI